MMVFKHFYFFLNENNKSYIENETERGLFIWIRQSEMDLLCLGDWCRGGAEGGV